MTAATYDGDGLRATAAAGAGNQNFTWNTVTAVPQLIMDSSNAYIYAGGATPAEQVNLTSGTSTYLVTDSLGSVRGTVSATGSLTGTIGYDAWGNPETSGGLTAATPFGYAGGYTDPTGLIYLLNRYYDPSIGQFISLDPAISQTLAPYGYADGNPVSNTDSDGLGKHSRPTHTCHRSWGTGTCTWGLNHASTEFTHRILDDIEIGEDAAGEALDLLPDVVGVILDLAGFACGRIAAEMEYKDIGNGINIVVYFVFYTPWRYSIHTRYW
jgi:RHS repeat-associated protein